MRRLVAILVLVTMSLLSATPAEAWWRHHCGWGGGWRHHGWRHCGWGGYSCYPAYTYNYCGYGGYGGYGYGGYGGWGGYGGYGGYSGVYFPHRYRSMWGYGGYYGYAAPASVGYYAARPTTINVPAVRTVALAKASPVYSQIRLGTTQEALRNFLGTGELRRLDIQAPALANLLARVADQRPAAPEMQNVRMANPEARRTAERHIADGDSLFRAQNFNSALQRYKLAAATAPDLAEAHWRHGHALVATHNYALATSAFKRAIALTDDLHRGGFNLDQLYGGASLTKTAHLESLSEWALSRPDSSDPYFLLGVFLRYDQQGQRAEKFFAYASDLAGISGGHIAVFEPPVEEPIAEVASVPDRISVPVTPGREI